MPTVMKKGIFDISTFIFIAISVVTTLAQSLSFVTISHATAQESGDLAKPISATFNEAMDVKTISSDTFIVKDWDGNNIAGTVSLSQDGKTATFTPSIPLQGSVDYTATISREAKDRSGNSLPSDKIWSFSIPASIQQHESRDISDEITSIASQEQPLQPFSSAVMPSISSSSSNSTTDDANTAAALQQDQNPFSSLPLTGSNNNNNPLESGAGLPGTTITSPLPVATGETQYLPPEQQQQLQLSPFTTLIQDIIPPETVITSVVDGNNFPLLQTAITGNVIHPPYSQYSTYPLAAPDQSSPTPNTGVTTSNSITLTFTGADSDVANSISGFECRHTGSIEFTLCTNPIVLQDLAPGSMHIFEVRAIDAAGNRDISPAMFSWITDVQGLLAQQLQPQQQPPALGTEPLATTPITPTLPQEATGTDPSLAYPSKDVYSNNNPFTSIAPGNTIVITDTTTAPIQ